MNTSGFRKSGRPHTQSVFLGLDAGTQSLKAVAVDREMRQVAGHSVNFDRDLPQFATQGGVHRHAGDLRVTAPPAMWAAALDLLLDGLRADGFPFERVAAVSGSGQQHGSVYLSRDADRRLGRFDPMKPLSAQIEPLLALPDAPVWMDSSTTLQCRELEKALGGPQALAELTGSRAFERFTGNQIAKIYRENPDAYARTGHIRLVSAFMASLVTGRVAPIDFADASGMNLMDIRRRQWAPAALAACAPELGGRLGAPAPAHADIGPVSDRMVRRYGFAPDCRVIAFSGDNPNSLAGLRLDSDGDLAVSLGTSDTLFGSLRDPRPSADEGHVFASPIDPEGYMALICFKNGSLTREWVRDLSAGGSWDGFRTAFERTPPGNNGRLAFYFREPEITPPALKTGVFRFDGSDRPMEAYDPEGEVRAIVESRFLAMRLHAGRLGLQPRRRLLATGGASRDPVMLRAMTDVFGVPVAVIDQLDSAALGAAARALHAWRCRAGERFIAFAEAVPEAAPPRAAAVPDSAAHSLYTSMLARYARLEARVCGNL